MNVKWGETQPFDNTVLLRRAKRWAQLQAIRKALYREWPMWMGLTGLAFVVGAGLPWVWRFGALLWGLHPTALIATIGGLLFIVGLIADS